MDRRSYPGPAEGSPSVLDRPGPLQHLEVDEAHERLHDRHPLPGLRSETGRHKSLSERRTLPAPVPSPPQRTAAEEEGACLPHPNPGAWTTDAARGPTRDRPPGGTAPAACGSWWWTTTGMQRTPS